MISNIRAVLLAAGKSSRFKTKETKLIHTICGQPMVLYPTKVLESLNIPITFVLGYQADAVKFVISSANIKNVTFVIQKEAIGTGNAVVCSKDTWDKDLILILYGDTPLLTKELIQRMIKRHNEKKATITFLTTYMLNPIGYGRVKKENGTLKIIEEKDCEGKDREINQVNTGMYLIDRKFLTENIHKIKKSKIAGEFYLTDLIEIASEQNLTIYNKSVPYDLVRGVNSLEELWAVEQIKRSELMKKFMNKGIRFELAQNIHLDVDVEIGSGCYIATGAHLINGTKIGKNCLVGAFSIIDNSTIGDNTKIHSHSTIKDSTIGQNVEIGPFARLRENVILKDNVTVGNFVEIKNSTIGEESKTKHLSYLGDTEVGKNVNIGAGTITCNHDGVRKNKTIIKDEAFIGSNNTLIAPLTIGKGAYTGAGSTINKDVEANDFAIARQRQENKKGYAKKLKNNDFTKKARSEQMIDSPFHFIGAIKTETGNEETI